MARTTSHYSTRVPVSGDVLEEPHELFMYL